MDNYGQICQEVFGRVQMGGKKGGKGGFLCDANSCAFFDYFLDIQAFSGYGLADFLA